MEPDFRKINELEDKPCKTCKYCKTSYFIHISWIKINEMDNTCCRPKRTKVDPVTGKLLNRNYPCSIERSSLSKDLCGEMGKFWEPI
jgi:hypothetical protein